MFSAKNLIPFPWDKGSNPALFKYIMFPYNFLYEVYNRDYFENWEKSLNIIFYLWYKSVSQKIIYKIKIKKSKKDFMKISLFFTTTQTCLNLKSILSRQKQRHIQLRDYNNLSFYRPFYICMVNTDLNLWYVAYNWQF